MMKEEVEQWVQAILKDEDSLYLIDCHVGSDNAIRVVLDGDSGVALTDCIRISRALEDQLEDEGLNFSLEVTSAGATSPIKLPRQYRKNIGRKLSVRTSEEQLEGTLVAATDDSIILEWKAREPKPVGKGKMTVQKKQEIAIEAIEEAKVKLKF